MPKYTDMLQLCAPDALPLALGPVVRKPAPVAPALAPVAGKPHLYRTPVGALVYAPPVPAQPVAPQPATPYVPASQVGLVDKLAGKPRGLYLVKRKGLSAAFRYWDGSSLSQSFSTEVGVDLFVYKLAPNLKPPGEDGSIEHVTPVEDVTNPLYRKLKHMGLV